MSKIIQLVNVLNEAAKEIDIILNSDQLSTFERYYKLLIEGNEKVNLTAITEPAEVAVKHFIDSISCLKVMEMPIGSTLLDIGTGAGFPGLPLKIIREDLDVTLLDSLNKRVAFLTNTIDQLALKNIRAIHYRAEDYGQNKEAREKYDYVVSRAVAKLAVLSEYCLPCVKVGGYFISQKGPEIKEEVNEAKSAINKLGGELTEVKNFSLPILGDGRSIIIIKKIKITPSMYPRKAGLPAKKPIT